MVFRDGHSSDGQLPGALLRALAVTAAATLVSLSAAAIWGSPRTVLWCGIAGEGLLVMLLLISLGAAAHEQQELIRARAAAARRLAADAGPSVLVRDRATGSERRYRIVEDADPQHGELPPASPFARPALAGAASGELLADGPLELLGVDE